MPALVVAFSAPTLRRPAAETELFTVDRSGGLSADDKQSAKSKGTRFGVSTDPKRNQMKRNSSQRNAFDKPFLSSLVSRSQCIHSCSSRLAEKAEESKALHLALAMPSAALVTSYAKRARRRECQPLQRLYDVTVRQIERRETAGTCLRSRCAQLLRCKYDYLAFRFDSLVSSESKIMMATCERHRRMHKHRSSFRYRLTFVCVDCRFSKETKSPHSAALRSLSCSSRRRIRAFGIR